MEGEADVLEDGGVVVGFGDVGELEEGRHGGERGEKREEKSAQDATPVWGEGEGEKRRGWWFIVYDFLGFWGGVLMFEDVRLVLWVLYIFIGK